MHVAVRRLRRALRTPADAESAAVLAGTSCCPPFWRSCVAIRNEMRPEKVEYLRTNAYWYLTGERSQLHNCVVVVDWQNLVLTWHTNLAVPRRSGCACEKEVRFMGCKEADLLLKHRVGSEQLLPERPLRRKVHLSSGGFGCRRSSVTGVDVPLQHT